MVTAGLSERCSLCRGALRAVCGHLAVTTPLLGRQEHPPAREATQTGACTQEAIQGG